MALFSGAGFWSVCQGPAGLRFRVRDKIYVVGARENDPVKRPGGEYPTYIPNVMLA